MATSGRRDGEPLPLLRTHDAMPWLAAGPSECAVALVFGREDSGLSNAELIQAGKLLCIQTGDAYSSLNLSHAVAVALHSWHETTSKPESASVPLPHLELEPTRRDALEALLADAADLLLAVGFLYPHTAKARMTKLRSLLQRAQITSEEVALLRGMVRQLRWASQRGAIPEE